MRDSYRFERHEGRSIFRRIQSSKGGLIKEVWYIFTSVKRGVNEARRKGEEGRSPRDIDVDVGTADHATNSGVSKEQCT